MEEKKISDEEMAFTADMSAFRKRVLAFVSQEMDELQDAVAHQVQRQRVGIHRVLHMHLWSTFLVPFFCSLGLVLGVWGAVLFAEFVEFRVLFRQHSELRTQIADAKDELSRMQGLVKTLASSFRLNAKAGVPPFWIYGDDKNRFFLAFDHRKLHVRANFGCGEKFADGTWEYSCVELKKPR